MSDKKTPRFAIVSANTPSSEVERLRGLGLRLIDEKFKDDFDIDDIYTKPKRKPKKTEV